MRRFVVAAIAVAAVLMVGAPAAALAKTVFVSTSGTDGAGCGTTSILACQSINGALNPADGDAVNGDTISVAAGTYDETTFTNVNKDVTIQGAGDGTNPASSTILTLATSSTTLSADPASNVALMYLGSAGSGSTIEDLTIDGHNAGGVNSPFMGLDIENATATVNTVQITDIESSPFGTNGQQGRALVDNDSGGAQSLTASALNVNHYQKSGVFLEGSGLTASVTGSTITGVGPTSALAQNGITFVSGATGTVSGNTITGNECDESGVCGPDQSNDEQAAGVLLTGSHSVTVSGNTINGNDVGILWGDPAAPSAVTATIQNNILNGNRDEDVLIYGGTANVSGNTISGSAFGVQVYSYSAGGDTANAVANLSGNSITGNTTGIEAGDDTLSNPTYYPVITAHFNEIDGNSISGFANDVSVPQNATQNWWGCSAGPNQPGCDRITGVGASLVSYSPWITSITALPPGIQAAFGSSAIPVGGTTTLTFTVTNPNNGSGLSGLAFSDTLPAGLQVSNPNGASGTCGGTLSAPAGGSTISLSGGTLNPSSSCTLTVSVTGTSAGQQNDSTSAITSTEGGTGNAAHASILVGSGPTIAISSPAQFATYAFGAHVNANYACQDSAGGPGIASCAGTVANGSPIATDTAGVHSFTVTATSQDGLSTTETVLYLVLPNNHFTVSHVKGHHNGNVTFDFVLPGPGTLTVVATAAKPGAKHGGRLAYGQDTAPVKGGSHSWVLHPGSPGKAALTAHPGGMFVRLFVTYEPRGVPANVTGTPSTQSFFGVRIPGASTHKHKKH